MTFLSWDFITELILGLQCPTLVHQTPDSISMYLFPPESDNSQFLALTISVRISSWPADHIKFFILQKILFGISDKRHFISYRKDTIRKLCAAKSATLVHQSSIRFLQTRGSCGSAQPSWLYWNTLSVKSYHAKCRHWPVKPGQCYTRADIEDMLCNPGRSRYDQTR